MGRVLSILGLGSLLCWIILIVLPSPYTQIFADTTAENAQIALVASLSIGLSLLVFSLLRKQLYSFLLSKGPVLFGLLFIVSNVGLTLTYLVLENELLLRYLWLVVASLSAAALVVFVFCLYGDYSEKVLIIFLPLSLFTAIAFSLAVSFFGKNTPFVVILLSLLEGIWLYFTLRNPEEHARIKLMATTGEKLYTAHADIGGKALFIISVCVLCFSFFTVFGYNTMVALFAGPGGQQTIFLTIVLCAITTGILILIQKKLGHLLLFSPLFGTAIAVQGILIMVIEITGASLIPFTEAISASMLIVVLTGISNLSQHFARLEVHSRIVALSILFIPIIVGLVLGASFAIAYMDIFAERFLIREVLLCILLCPFALLSSRVQEIENHFFFVVASKSGNKNGSHLPFARTTAPDLVENSDASRDGESPLSDGEQLQNDTALSLQYSLNNLAGAHGLTEREKEILNYLMRGRDIVFISNDLFISKNTVSTHIRHIYQKLNIHSKQELISMAEQMKQGAFGP